MFYLGGRYHDEPQSRAPVVIVPQGWGPAINVGLGVGIPILGL